MFHVSFADANGNTISSAAGDIELASYAVKHTCASEMRRVSPGTLTVNILRDNENILNLTGDAETIGIVAKRKMARLRKEAHAHFLKGELPENAPENAPESYGDY